MLLRTGLLFFHSHYITLHLMSELTVQNKRMAQFLIGCIGIRALFVIGAAKADKNTLWYFGILAVILAIGWVLIYRFDLRPTGREAGGVIWWNSFRPVHALLYFAFAGLAFTGSDYAWVPLLADVLVGLGAHTVRYH